MKIHNLITFLFICSIVPRYAYASDFSRFYSFSFFLCIVVPSILINQYLIRQFQKRNYYSSYRLAVIHTVLASIIPIAGLVIAIYETYNILPIYNFEPYKELLIAVIFYSILFFTTAKPLTLHRKIEDEK